MVLLVFLLPVTQAAEQPKEVPAELRNGQETRFGRIEMEPYVPAGGEPVAVEAEIVLRDLDALVRAETVMLALNLHSRDADVAIDGVFSDGVPLTPVRTETNGLQKQVFVAADDVAAHARDGSVALTLRGQATAKHDGQVHVGALVVAYDAGWSPIQSADGPAQLYAYSLLQAKGAGAGIMPFHGQGNSLLVLPFVVLSALVLLAGGLAIEALRSSGADVLVPAPVPVAAASPMPVAATPQRPTSVPMPAPERRRVVIGKTEVEVPLAGPVPVFGSPESPTLRKPAPTPAIATPVQAIPMAPRQGPLLPPHWVRRPAPAQRNAEGAESAETKAPSAASAPSAPAPAASKVATAPTPALPVASDTGAAKVPVTPQIPVQPTVPRDQGNSPESKETPAPAAVAKPSSKPSPPARPARKTHTAVRRPKRPASKPRQKAAAAARPRSQASR